MNRPDVEPCGCVYGAAGFPPFTERLVECGECGAVWTTAEDVRLHRSAAVDLPSGDEVEF
jgi:hypothetical protein